MADEHTQKSLDPEKTVLIRPEASGWHKTTEAYNQNTDGSTNERAGSTPEETQPIRSVDTLSVNSSAAPSNVSNVQSEPGILRISPQTPPVAPTPGNPVAPEPDHTRVIRPSVSSQTSGPASVGGKASADLDRLKKEGPVVGWFVVVKGPGTGLFRPIYYGNNTIGRNEEQRVPLNFGDDAISSEEQAYVRYDSADRTYLLIPNLAKSNLVSLNQQRPAGPVPLSYGDIIQVGETQLMFVPLCSSEFDWADVEGQ